MKGIFKFLLYALVLVGFYLLSICVTTFLKTNSFSLDLSYATSGTTIFIFALVCGIILLKILFDALDGKNKKKKKKGGLADKGKDEQGNEVKQYFSTDFVSVKDLETKPEFNFTTFKS